MSKIGGLLGQRYHRIGIPMYPRLRDDCSYFQILVENEKYKPKQARLVRCDVWRLARNPPRLCSPDRNFYSWPSGRILVVWFIVVSKGIDFSLGEGAAVKTQEFVFQCAEYRITPNNSPGELFFRGCQKGGSYSGDGELLFRVGNFTKILGFLFKLAFHMKMKR